MLLFFYYMQWNEQISYSRKPDIHHKSENFFIMWYWNNFHTQQQKLSS